MLVANPFAEQHNEIKKATILLSGCTHDGFVVTVVGGEKDRNKFVIVVFANYESYLYFAVIN